MEHQRFLALHDGKYSGLRSDINSLLNYWPPFWANMVAAASLLSHKNERQQCDNNFWPDILEYCRAAQRLLPILELLAVFLGGNPYDNIATMS